MRVGTTSYIYPAGIIDNVKKLRNKVNDIELVLFETAKESNLPSQKEIETLYELSLRNNLTYTVHLPLSISLAHSKKEERFTSVKSANEIINLTLPLNPFAYIIHIAITDDPFQKGFFNIETKKLLEWQKRAKESLTSILNNVKNPSLLSIENINYPFEYLTDLIYELDISICLDIGHLILYSSKIDKNKNSINVVKSHLDRYLSKIKVIHLHGVFNRKDHRALIPIYKKGIYKKQIQENSTNRTIINILKMIKEMKFTGVLTLEVFNKYDLISSLWLVNNILK